jgi:hypothetical protein
MLFSYVLRSRTSNSIRRRVPSVFGFLQCYIYICTCVHTYIYMNVHIWCLHPYVHTYIFTCVPLHEFLIGRSNLPTLGTTIVYQITMTPQIVPSSLITASATRQIHFLSYYRSLVLYVNDCDSHTAVHIPVPYRQTHLTGNCFHRISK